MTVIQSNSTTAAHDKIQGGYRWQPRSVNVWISMEPYNTLQAFFLRELRARLETRGCIFVDPPDTETELGPVAHLGIAFGRDLEEEISPVERLGLLPKPRGMMLIVNTVPNIPPNAVLFDLARGQLVRKSGQIGVTLEGDPDGEHIERALWASMPGNNAMLEGLTDEILDSISLRTLAHCSADKVNDLAAEEEGDFTWDAWCASRVHEDITHAARALGAAGLIEDEVPLHNYGTGGQVQAVLRFLKRAALGEGMRSQLDLDLGVMAVTTSGGNKITISPDPGDGHIVPIRQLTWDGYIVTMPQGAPVSYISPSVETHENGMVYLAGSLVNAGIIDTYDSFLDYLYEHFTTRDRIDIIPAGLTPKVTAIDHFHRQPVKGTIKEPERVEIVYPDHTRFPSIDFPCGVREAELHLLSALFQSETFRRPGPMGDRVIIAVLPGHGLAALYDGPRRELTDMLVNGMQMEEIVRI